MPTPALDEDSAAWCRALGATGEVHEAAVARLHALLLRVARAEARRRTPSLPERGREEVDELTVQAANDAVLAVLRKLPQFRGTARFTTWACKFVIFEISTRLRRHAWRHRRLETGDAMWETLPDRARPALTALQDAEMIGTLERLVQEELTERQRLVFQAAVFDEVPIDVLAERMGSTRGAIYKILFDARLKLRRGLAAAGYGEQAT